jgi:hypothetical protein
MLMSDTASAGCWEAVRDSAARTERTVAAGGQTPGQGVGGVQQAQQACVFEDFVEFAGAAQAVAGGLPVGDGLPSEDDPAVVGGNYLLDGLGEDGLLGGEGGEGRSLPF